MISLTPDGPIPEAAIDAFEVEFDITLPHEYRAWLLEVGGGEADRDYGVENGIVSEFLTLGGTLGYDLASVRRGTTGFSAWVPRDWLVISAGAGGDVTVKVKGDDAGSIWWADYDLGAEINGAPGEDASSGQPLPHIMRPLAADLASFLRHGGNAG